MSSYITHARAVQITAAGPYLFMLDSKGRIWRIAGGPDLSERGPQREWELVKLPTVDEWSEEAKVNLEEDELLFEGKWTGTMGPEQGEQ